MRQRGFIQLPLMGWAALAAGVVILALSVALKVQSSRLESEQQAHVATQAKFAGFVAETKRLGDEAKAKADAQAKADKQAKEKTDASYKSDLANLADAYRRLRDSRAGAGGSILPAPEAGSRSPERASFNRAELDLALRNFDTGVAGIVEEGDKARIGLDAAKRWAAGP